jgi:hypothetical protein
MTRQPVNIEDVTARARTLVDQRMESVHKYAASVNEATAAREKLVAAEKAQRAAWRACLKAGWSERSLMDTGLPRPPQGAGRPRKPAPESNFRQPGISTGDGVLDVPAPEAGDPVVDDLASFDPDGGGPPNVVVDLDKVARAQ